MAQSASQVVLGLEPSWTYEITSTQLGTPSFWVPDSKSSKKPLFLEMFLGFPIWVNTSMSSKSYFCNGNAQIVALTMMNLRPQNDPTTFHVKVNVWHELVFWCSFHHFVGIVWLHDWSTHFRHCSSVIPSGCRPFFLTWMVAIQVWSTEHDRLLQNLTCPDILGNPDV